MLQKAEATMDVPNIRIYYLVQLNQQLPLCIGDVNCMDNFLTVLNPPKNNTDTINLESKIYNTDNVPFELPFP